MTAQDELMHYGVLGMKWGQRRDTIRTMSKPQKQEAKKAYKNMSKDERTANLLKSDKKLLEDFNKLTGQSTKGLDGLQKPLKTLERNALQMKTDRLNKIKSISNLDRTMLDVQSVTIGQGYATRLLDTMGRKNLSYLEAKKKTNTEDAIWAFLSAM